MVDVSANWISFVSRAHKITIVEMVFFHLSFSPYKCSLEEKKIHFSHVSSLNPNQITTVFYLERT